MSKQAETRFREKFCKQLIERYGSGVYIQKHHGSEFSAGLPDTFIGSQSLPEYHINAFVEFKVVEPPRMGIAIDWTQQPTRLQMHTLGRIAKALGDDAAWVIVGVDAKPYKVVCVPYQFVKIARDRNMVWPTDTLLGNSHRQACQNAGMQLGGLGDYGVFDMADLATRDDPLRQLFNKWNPDHTAKLFTTYLKPKG